MAETGASVDEGLATTGGDWQGLAKAETAQLTPSILRPKPSSPPPFKAFPSSNSHLKMLVDAAEEVCKGQGLLIHHDKGLFPSARTAPSTPLVPGKVLIHSPNQLGGHQPQGLQGTALNAVSAWVGEGRSGWEATAGPR